MTYNSRRATELGKWAEEAGCGDAYHHAVFRAYFGEGKNIADLTVLKALCREVGLDPHKAERVLAEKTFEKAVNDDWRLSQQLGVTVVPTLFLAGRFLVGAQPYEALKEFVSNIIQDNHPVTLQKL
jgi:predicted DsbA family dithiol-disulfide isomerase